MRKIITLFLLLAFALPQALLADHADIVWPMGNKDNLAVNTLTEGAANALTPSFVLGANLAATGVKISSDADTEHGYAPVDYDPVLVMLTPSTRVSAKTAGHAVSYRVTPKSGHTFKPTVIEFDAAKCGTDGGNFDVYIKAGTAAETALETAVSPLRNKIDANNSTGKSHHRYAISDQLVAAGQSFQLILYVYNLNGQDTSSPKSMAFSNVTISGEIDEPIYDASHYFTAASCSAGDLLSVAGALKNGQTASWPEKLYGDPTDLSVTPAEGYTANITYADKYITLTAFKGAAQVFSVSIRFVVSYRPPKPEAKPLNRGLMAVKTSSGVLVSWRYRASDETLQPRFRLWRGKTLLNSRMPFTDRTNFLDTGGGLSSLYKLEVVDPDGNILETQETRPWDGQVKYITLQGGAPTDPTAAGATYTPNDASFCDMDGDGEYDIILKWAPSNEKDAASSGTTSPAFYSCYKLDGTRLWMLHTGHNMFNSAHTTHFAAWDFDGDGYGEVMLKTAPGAVDGQGNYVLLPGDDPKANYKGGKGKQETGGEYLTVFDGMTGAELKTIPYHTKFADETASFWGDSKQNRSERYLGAIAWLDGEKGNPSGIFARGYYNGCKIGAYDWDGDNLTLRWLHRGESATKGTVTYANGTVKNLTTTVYGEGCHWICVGDVDGDGKQEIHYGSGGLKPDGTTLYRTGLGHGDAMHLSDFVPSRPGLELFMVHEEKPYGMDMRDARTGELLLHQTAGSDTGRGIMAHFNPEAANAYWQFSASASLFDTDGNTILSECNHGGGAGLSFRVYWNGDLADDFYGKNVLENWNPDNNSFGRMQINGAPYVVGNYNNDSKQNPCVSGDLLGDWREEIVTWDQSGSDYRLVINATDYPTDYRLPHLMDDFAYRAQLIGQNDCYNQPPHVSYDPITRYTIERTVPASGLDVLYAPYPVRLPQDVTAYSVTFPDAAADTLKYTTLKAFAIIPAGAAVVYKGTPGEKVAFRPSTRTVATVNKNYLKGCAVDSVIVSNDDTNEFCYTFRVDSKTGAVGFFKVEEPTLQKANTPWLRVKGTAANPPHPQYFWTKDGIPDAVRSLPAATPAKADEIYDLSGRPVAPNALKSGHTYIINGEKRQVR